MGSFQEDGRCRLLPAGTEVAAGATNTASSAGSSSCTPPRSERPLPAASALAVLDSPALAACDAADEATCPDLNDAAQTWMYGIRRLEESIDDFNGDIAEYVQQIAGDAEQILKIPTESFVRELR